MSRFGIRTYLAYRLSMIAVKELLQLHSCDIRLCCKQFVVDMCRNYVVIGSIDDRFYIEYLNQKQNGIMIDYEEDQYIVTNRDKIICRQIGTDLVILEPYVQVSWSMHNAWRVMINYPRFVSVIIRSHRLVYTLSPQVPYGIVGNFHLDSAPTNPWEALYQTMRVIKL